MEINYPQQLKRHLGFLNRSCADFDSGHVEEALRIAVSLRVLIHDTKNSTSLLTHLGIKNIARVLTTFEPGYSEDKSTGRMSVFIPMCVDSFGTRTAPLDNAIRREFISISEWWDEIIIGTNNRPSRKDVILGAADKAGGAHVDSKLDEKTKSLIDGVGKFQVTYKGVTKSFPLSDHHFYLLRQFAHEVLSSPDITKGF